MLNIPLFLPCLGIINALGNNKQQVLQHLYAADQPLPQSVNVELPHIDKALCHFDCRNNRLLLAAYEQIQADVQQLIAALGEDRIAVVIGSSTSGIADGEQAFQTHFESGKFPVDYHYQQQEMGSTSEFLATYLGLTNIATTVSTACSSSGQAFLVARNLIVSGVCDAALVGGVDTLCQLTLQGFDALGLISPNICNPFSHQRDGMTIGESAALFILSKTPSMLELGGLGSSSDAYHMSTPQPQGLGAIAAMQAALDDAGLTADQIDYLNLHGTATRTNDQMESEAVASVFARPIVCSSSKPQLGHTLGAASATELGLCWLVLSDFNVSQQLPPHIWDGQQDPDLPVLNFVQPGQTLKSSPPYYCMSNSFAFGGNNVSIIIGRKQAKPQYAVADVIPHQGDMIFIDHILSECGDTLTASVTIKKTTCFFKQDLGVPTWVGIEYMAQAISAWAGIQAIKAGLPIRLGFLLGTRQYKTYQAYFLEHQVLSISVQRIYADDELGVFACQIEDQDVIAEATLNVYQQK